MRGSFFIGKLYRRCFGINDLMINEEIRDREVRVVDQSGEQLGVMPFPTAIIPHHGPARRQSPEFNGIFACYRGPGLL